MMIDIMKNWMIQCVYVLLMIYNADCNANVERIENCKTDKQYVIDYQGKFKCENNHLILEDVTFKTAVDMSDDLDLNIDLYSFEDGQWKLLLTQKGKMCEMEKKFAGEFALELEKAAGIPNGCPYSKGEYKLANYKIDLAKMAFKDFPDGKLMLRKYFLDGKTKEELGCLETEFSFKKP